MILGPDDPRARRREDAVFTGSTLSDFDKFLETADGKALIDAVLNDLKEEA